MIEELTTMSKQIRAELRKFQRKYRNLLYSRPTDLEVDKREQQMIAALREQMEDELSYCRDIEECNKAMRDYHATSFTTVQVVTECEM